MMIPKRFEKEIDRIIKEYFEDNMIDENITLEQYFQQHASKECLLMIQKIDEEKRELEKKGIILN